MRVIQRNAHWLDVRTANHNRLRNAKIWRLWMNCFRRQKLVGRVLMKVALKTERRKEQLVASIEKSIITALKGAQLIIQEKLACSDFNLVRQHLGCTTYARTIAVAQILINNKVNSILLPFNLFFYCNFFVLFPKKVLFTVYFILFRFAIHFIGLMFVNLVRVLRPCFYTTSFFLTFTTCLF